MSVSFSEVNMCRILFVVVFLAYVSCVLSSSEKAQCFNTDSLKNHRTDLTTCFNHIVANSIQSVNAPPTPMCKKSTELGEKLKDYFNELNTTCQSNIKVETTKFIELVEFSLHNNTFKEFVKDIDCFVSVESNISQCVKNKVGFFNATLMKKTTPWFYKLNVKYDNMTCDVAKKVLHCTELSLNKCKSIVPYVRSLFEFTFKNCPPPTNPTAKSKKAPILSEPVIITLSVGAVLLLQATQMLQGYATH